MNFENTWSKIQIVIDKLKTIVQGEKKFISALEYSDVYSLIYDLCIYRKKKEEKRVLPSGQTVTHYAEETYIDKLYDKYAETINDYLSNVLLPTLLKSNNYLKDFEEQYQQFQLFVSWMKKILNYLDRYYVTHNQLPSLEEKANSIFINEVFERINPKLLSILITEILENRNNYTKDRSIIVKCINIYKSEKMYTSEFEPKFLHCTTAYYSFKCIELFESRNMYEFFEDVESIYQFEHSNPWNLELDTLEKVKDILSTKLVESVYQRYLETGFSEMLEKKKTEDIKRVIRVLMFNGTHRGITGSYKYVSNLYENFLKEEATDIIKSEDINKVIMFHNKIQQMNECYFNNIFEFLQTLKNVLVYVVERIPKVHNLISSYIDQIVRESGTEYELNQVFLLFNYVQDKDKLIQCYSNLLAKRLLGNKRDICIEKVIVSKIRECYGRMSTVKLEGMINDITLSEEYVKTFSSTSLNCQVQVITYGNWPKIYQPSLSLPEPLVKCKVEFEDHFKGITTKKRLTWLDWLGTVVIKAVFPNFTYDLYVSTPQCAVLYAVKEGTQSFEELLKKVNVTEKHLKALLHSLSCNKHKILVKSTNDKIIKNSDTFEINLDFSNNSRVVRFQVPIVEEVQEQSLEEDRRHVIDACIVRVMKSRRVIAHSDLILEVLKQIIFFKPSLRQIKERVCYLIEKEYIKRDENKTNEYHYVA